GVIGSGLAVFSRHRIQNALLYQFSLNGSPYMVHHGDWFGGKGVGLVILDVFGLKVNAYVTHLHAEYSRAKDDYLPHRIVQSWQLLQFVRHTSGDADVVVVGGDLNLHPQDLGNRLLRAHTGLRDCYTETHTFDGCEDGITLIADNHFTKKQDLVPFEKGIRIDYILIKLTCDGSVSPPWQGSETVNLRCESMSTTKGSVPDKPFPYSDHEALTTELVLERPERTDPCRNKSTGGTGVALSWLLGFVLISSLSSEASPSEQLDVTAEACAVVREGLAHTEALRLKAMCLLAAGLLLLLLEVSVALLPCSCSFSTLGLLAAACSAFLLCGGLLYIFFTTQLKALRETESQMKLSSEGLQARVSGFRGSVSKSLDNSPEFQRLSPLRQEE
ncbi:hypothetical protein NFI96_017234, partial [Prochilodus magdalenae]